MKKLLYDVEVYPNFFCVTFKEYQKELGYYFEISSARNDAVKLKEFLTRETTITIGFNSLHYDKIIINYILDNVNLSTNLLIEGIKKVSDSIIDDNYEYYKDYKWTNRFKTYDIDLYSFWSKGVRMIKKISLKGLAAQLGYPKLQELPYSPNTVLTTQQMQNVSEYNINDVHMTEWVCHELENKIKFRFDIKKSYGFNCLSWDDVKIGTNILGIKYSDYSGLPYDAFKDKKTFHDSVKLQDIINENIYFKETKQVFKQVEKTIHCNSFFTLLNHIKQREVNSTNQLNYTVLYGGVKHDIGSGGIHSYHNPIIYSSENQIIHDIDVASYYPSLGIEWNISPNHLPGLSNMLRDIKKERLEHKRSGNKLESDSLKLSMNGGYFGNLNNKYSWLYDWEKALKITINGQLYLCMLSEWFTDNNIEVLMLNTDGITVRYDEDKTNLVNDLVKKWEEISKMEMESNYYDKLVVRDVNNYIWIKKDKSYKTKGVFKEYKDIPLGDKTDFTIIAKAWKNYFVNGIEVEQTIQSERDILSFCASPKVAKSYKVWHEGIQRQNLNRYFVANKGGYLYKEKNGSMNNMLVGYPVSLLNDYTDKDASKYDINYQFYIEKAKSLINDLEPQQLTLF